MLFLLWGASGSGKTTVMNALRGYLPNLPMHDFDEVDVPPDADTAWRQKTAEAWVRRALDYQTDGRDMLLSAQLPLGELLAAPSSPDLDGVRSCLLDCSDYERIERIRSRDGGSDRATQDMLCWAVWMRMHAREPSWCPDVITGEADPFMQWGRWSDLTANDSEWPVQRVDSTGLTVDETARAVRQVFGFCGVVHGPQEQGTPECP